MRPPVKVPNEVRPVLSVQLMVRWYSPGWSVLPRNWASSVRVSANCSVKARLVEKPVPVLPVTGKGLLSGKVAESGAVPSAWTGPTMVWLTAPVPLGHGPEVVELIGVLPLPEAGWGVRDPRVPGGTAAPASGSMSNADPVATAATTAPVTSRVDSFFLYTECSLSFQK